MTVTLDSTTIERIAERVVELLRDEPMTGELVDAAEVARRFNVSRQWVYENAAPLGAVRLGDGERPRLRFDPDVVADRLNARPDRAAPPRRREPRRPHTRGELLPVRGRTS